MPMRPLRGLRASPGAIVLAFATLTLAIAAATTTFSVVDAIVLRRLPFPDDGRLVAISRVSIADPTPQVVAPQDFYAWHEGTSSFESLGAVAAWTPSRIGPAGQQATVVTSRATSSLFDVLRVRPALGSLFTPDHERAGNDLVALISDRIWVRHFGADPAVVGTMVSFGRQSRRVLGVMPPGFTYPIGTDAPSDVWIPLVPRDSERDPAFGGRSRYMAVVGRLRPDVTLAQARADVDRVRDRAEAEYPASGWKDVRARTVLLRDHIVGPAKGWMLLVLGAVTLVLLVACANVANLLLARATSRQRDLAIRRALGASRGRLFVNTLTGSLGLAAASTTAGVIVASWGVDLARTHLPAGLARASDIALDLRVLTAACAAAAVTALLCGLAPAWQASRADVVTLMKGGPPIAGLAGAGRLRSLFLVAEVAFVAVLLVGTTLLITSFARVSQVDLGFEPRNFVGFQISPRVDASDDDQRREALRLFYATVLDAVSRVPGIAAAGVVDGGHYLGGGTVQYPIAGFGSGRGDDMVEVRAISPGYLQASGMQLIRGRALVETDAANGSRVALVNDIVAARFFRDQDPVGRTIDLGGPIEIVGVVRVVRTAGPEVAERPQLFTPLAQHPQAGGFGTPVVAFRLSAPAEAVMPALQAALQDVLPASTRLPAPISFEEALNRLTAQRRFTAGLMSAFGLLALLIGAAGVYAVMSFVVAQRTRELGIRVAIGASASRVLRTVLAQAGRHLAVGLVVGVIAARALSSVIGSLLFDVQPNDTSVYLIAAAVLLGAGLAAAIVPAVRATRVDPLTALRTE